MNISNYYWYFSGVLTPKFCDDVIAYANQQEETMARTGGFGDRKLSKEEVKDLKRKRNSDLVWLNDTWIYKELHPYVHEANRNAGWNFDWERSESCQFTKYKHNQYYDWHCDSWDKPYQRDDVNNPEHEKNTRVVRSAIDKMPASNADFKEYTFNIVISRKHVISLGGSLKQDSIIKIM